MPSILHKVQQNYASMDTEKLMSIDVDKLSEEAHCLFLTELAIRGIAYEKYIKGHNTIMEHQAAYDEKQRNKVKQQFLKAVVVIVGLFVAHILSSVMKAHYEIILGVGIVAFILWLVFRKHASKN